MAMPPGVPDKRDAVDVEPVDEVAQDRRVRAERVVTIGFAKAP